MWIMTEEDEALNMDYVVSMSVELVDSNYYHSKYVIYATTDDDRVHSLYEMLFDREIDGETGKAYVAACKYLEKLVKDLNTTEKKQNK